MRRWLGVVLAVCAPVLARAEWPQTARAAPVDPLRTLRWPQMSAWIAPSPVLPREALATLEAAEASPAVLQSRAVALRLLARPDDAERALADARARLGGGLTDPDAMLTAAWLDARRSNFADAVPVARAAMMRLAATSEALTLTVARWSLARGPEGLADARALLDGLRVVGACSPRAAALQVLVLARGGDEPAAQSLAQALGPALAPPLAEPHPADRQDPAFPEQINAVGVALLLAGRAADAGPLLRRAAEQTPPGWRAFQQRMSLRAPR
ncbi:MAG: hypothetical protein U0325_18345 [Polyangiales bacterium]